MSSYTDDDLDSLSDIRHLVTAAAAVARLDEALKRTKSAEPLYHAATLRREAINIAALEGSLVRMESLCRLLGNKEATNLEMSVRLAADIHAALLLVAAWGDEAPSAEQIRTLFDVSDASKGRRLKQDLVWSLEEDCFWLHNELLAFMEKPNPWDAMENLRSLWTIGRFLGTAKRMALLVAGWMLARGFGCALPTVGLAAYIIRDTDGFRDAAQSRITWVAKVGHALVELGADGMKKIEDGAMSKTSMLALCPPEKNSSSVERAIEFMMTTPVFSAKAFAKSLDLTARGAKVVLDKLEEADVVEVDGGLRNRNFVCRRAM
ncbi:hypothetical protein OIU34_17095 [Pararhizobium sp. BT-229]|uniref:hypothetical protein n=1 Tax=Pararhizobium sp. BT-229 TaxID=2986923 RepID=UPI0021F7B781|nr:hypothetical protein [Pararhizobium sp. BT-229]MCV9963618.1 hypothetical protein [Pararhizobium sp. BT-229]